MKTVQVIFHYQGIQRFQIAHIEDEFLFYKDVPDIDDDRDFWLSNAAVDSFLEGPFANPPEEVRQLLDKQNQWVIEVTEYVNLETPTQYLRSDIEEKQKAARRARILAGMSPEDRKLFE
jgi:hypothetical protein